MFLELVQYKYEDKHSKNTVGRAREVLTLAGEGGSREVSATGSTLSLSLSPMLMPMSLARKRYSRKIGCGQDEVRGDGVNDMTWASPSVAYGVKLYSIGETSR